MKQWQKGWVCPECNKAREEDNGPDPCLGYLPGVETACCGHGGHGDYYEMRHGHSGDRGYIYFENGVVVEFDAASTQYRDILRTRTFRREIHPLPDGLLEFLGWRPIVVLLFTSLTWALDLPMALLQLFAHLWWRI